MPRNENQRVVELLSWHGHDAGGVRVPFRGGGEPLGRVLETPLVARLKQAAADIASGNDTPRWIFLVGGPGNGKSQMVEVFIRELGARLGCERELIDLVQSQFAGTPIPRLVEVQAADNGSGLPADFAERVGQLAIVQDASASDDAAGDASATLADDLARLLARPAGHGEPPPVFICCANRGLLARAMASAAQTSDDTVELLETIVRATSLGAEWLTEPTTCWPLELPDALLQGQPDLAGMVGCWPLDIESLLFGYEDGGSPVEEVVEHAVAPSRWEASGCDGCSSQPACPFFANATALREARTRGSVLGLLRRAELASGQRWNFRAVFSLLAELVVGEWTDFTEGDRTLHPCQWVHGRLEAAGSADPTVNVSSAWLLAERLLGQSLFPTDKPKVPSRALDLTVNRDVPVTTALIRHLAAAERPVSTAIRQRLKETVAPLLDPAAWSPTTDDHPLAGLENAYAQSVSIGLGAWPADAPPTRLELLLLDLLGTAERECEEELQGIYAARAGDGVRLVRQLASGVAKRSVGVRRGLHANEDYLKEYEQSLRNPTKLNGLQGWLRQLLGYPLFKADALESFGQARSEDAALVVLETTPMRIRSTPAPLPAADRPAHDLPVMRVDDYPVPLTFGLFEALQLRRDGCATGSLTPSVRALLDRIRQIHAGATCRDEAEFIEGGTKFAIRGRGRVTVETSGGEPRFIA